MPNVHSPGDNIRAEMSRRKLPQSAMAAHLGISQAAISRRLNGETPFDVNELQSVAAWLGVTAAVLLGEGVAA